MESVYLEATFISYLVARLSRDLLVAAHQQVTQDRWANRRGEFENYISQVVIDEASAGDPAEVQKRLAIIGGLPTLQMTEDVEALTQAIVAAGTLPPNALDDAAHVAVAAVHAINYLLTWNCKHLANAQIARRIGWCVRNWGIGCPLSVRPKNSWEDSVMWEDPIVAEVHRTREKLAAEYGFGSKKGTHLINLEDAPNNSPNH